MLMMRSENPIYARARRYAQTGALIAVALFVVGGVWVRSLRGFILLEGQPGMPSNPMRGQHVSMEAGAWLHNYAAHPVLWLLPVLGIFSMLAGAACVRANRPYLAWWTGLGSWIGTIGTVAGAMFPFFMPSTTNPDQSLTIWNSSASQYGLTCMLVVALIFVPLILSYTAWCYYIMGGKVRTETIVNDTHSY